MAQKKDPEKGIGKVIGLTTLFVGVMLVAYMVYVMRYIQ
jgi:hypothetical protein